MKKILLVGIGERIVPEMSDEYDLILVGDGRSMPDCVHSSIQDIPFPTHWNQQQIATEVRELHKTNQMELDK